MYRQGLPAEAWRLARSPRVLAAAVLAAVLGAAAPLAMGWLLDLALPAQSRWMVVVVAAAVAVATVLLEGARVFQFLATLHLVADQAGELGVRALGGLGAAKARQDLEGDAAAAGGLLGQAMDAWGMQASGLLMGAAGLGAGLLALVLVGLDLSGVFALGITLGVGMLMGWASGHQRTELRRLEGKRVEAQAASAEEVADLSASLATLKSLPAGEHSLGRPAFARLNRLGLAVTATTAKWSAFQTVLRISGGLAVLVVLWLPGTRTPGALAAGVSAILVVLGAMEGLLGVWVSLEAYGPVRRRLEGLAALPPARNSEGIDPGPLRELRARGLWFRYSATGPWVLENVDLDLDLVLGEIRHLRWPSGAGKSTLLRLLAGVLCPEQGAITVNGIPLEHLDLEAYRRRLGVLTQEATILTGSVLDILRPALRGPDLEGEAWALLEAVEADEMVRAMPLGLHTRLIQGGAGLSGGETRRLALARALHPEAGLLLLDEPLAGLGETTAWLEAKIRAKELMALVVGHEMA